ncbi:conserved exported hypothetical protein [Gammaproteobacteria bacterium]
MIPTKTVRKPMKNLNLKYLVVALMAVGLTTGMAYAGDDKAPNMSDKKAATHSEKVQAVDNLLLARQMATYASAHQDALGLVVAARMIQNQPTQEAKWDKEGGAKEVVSDPLTVDGLLAQAREHSGGRAEVIALIEETAKRGAAKGRVGGPWQHIDTIPANTMTTYSNINFRGGEEAIIGVVGDGKTDIDCYVYDQGDHLITSDTDSTSVCDLKWNPIWTGPFTLKIKNAHSRASTYAILTN